MRIGLITTLNTNIGDDFIREGICFAVKKIFHDRQIQFIPVNKHQPFTVYPKWHIIRLAIAARYLPRGKGLIGKLLENFFSKFGMSRFNDCDLIIQCGAPVFWPDCHRAEWINPLWYNTVGPLSKRIPVLNIAAGSCYPWKEQPSQISNVKDRSYLKRILSYCRLTTVRDSLAQRLCMSLGQNVPMIPCSALFASEDKVGQMRQNGLVLINYMSGGGHYGWEQGIDTERWHHLVKKLIFRVQKRHRLAFLCHNEIEYHLAEGLDSSIPRFWPKTSIEFFTIVSEAKAAICNRLHASIGMAGMGIPSIAVGTDTRLLMVKAVDLPCFYVMETSAELLEEQLEGLICHRNDLKAKLLALKSQAWHNYIETISNSLQQYIKC
jgi:hypothetical protein